MSTAVAAEPGPPAAAGATYATRMKAGLRAGGPGGPAGDAAPANPRARPPPAARPRPAQPPGRAASAPPDAGPPVLAMGPPHYNTATRDIERFLAPFRPLAAFVPVAYAPPQLADRRVPGALLPVVYAVLLDAAHADEVLRTKDERLDREFCTTLHPQRASYQDLLAAIFPPYVRGVPEAQQTYVTRESVDGLLRICKDPIQGQTNRHMDRPFIMAMAVVKLFPWHLFPPYAAQEPPAQLVAQRDLVYELARRSMECLYSHLTSDTSQRAALRKVSDMFCEVVFKVFIRCPGFTDEEKKTLVADGNWDPSYMQMFGDFETPIMTIWARRTAAAAAAAAAGPAQSPVASAPTPTPTPQPDNGTESAATPQPADAPEAAPAPPSPAPAPADEQQRADAAQPTAEQAPSPVPDAPAPAAEEHAAVKEAKKPRERKSSANARQQDASAEQQPPSPANGDAPQLPRKSKPTKAAKADAKARKSATPPAVPSPTPPADAPAAAAAEQPPAEAEAKAAQPEAAPQPEAVPTAAAATQTPDVPASASEPEPETAAAAPPPQSSRKRSKSVPSPRKASPEATDAEEDAVTTRSESRSPTRTWNLEAKEFEVTSASPAAVPDELEEVTDADIILQEDPVSEAAAQYPDAGVVPTLSAPPPGAFAAQAPVAPAGTEADMGRARHPPPTAFSPTPYYAGAPFPGPFSPTGALPPHPPPMMAQKTGPPPPVPSGAYPPAPPPQGYAAGLPPPSPTQPPTPMSSTGTFLQHFISDRLMTEQQYRQMLYTQIERNWLEHLEGWYQVRRSAEAEAERRRWAEVEAVVTEVWQLCYDTGMEYPDDGSVLGMLKNIRRWTMERAWMEKTGRFPAGGHPGGHGFPGGVPMHGYPPQAHPGAHPGQQGVPARGPREGRAFIDPAIVSFRANSPHSSASSGVDPAGGRPADGMDGFRGPLRAAAHPDMPPGLYPMERSSTSVTMVDSLDEAAHLASAEPVAHHPSARARSKGRTTGPSRGGYRAGTPPSHDEAGDADGWMAGQARGEYADRGGRRGRGRSGDKHHVERRVPEKQWGADAYAEAPAEAEYAGQVAQGSVKAKMEGGAKRS
ncbi:hypothetical protein DFJ74DRAFT_716040 [Hyaloraphidium curvatum]|nr:hypothetical protein DFJ74DRAFT_716040 [Hyaloraphidium curvatum]